MAKVHKTLDARGLSCPMPIVKSMQAIKKIRMNQVLEILTSDPGSKKDIPIWVTATHQECARAEEYCFLVKRMK